MTLPGRASYGKVASLWSCRTFYNSPQKMLTYPGTPQHQALLTTIVSRYHQDPRVLAVVVFGSLGRGGWDALSDIDLDVVIADDTRIDVVNELRKLCTAFAPLGEHAALIVPDGEDAGDVVLKSLMQLSVRYHPLAETSPNIVSSMQVLAGVLDHAAIATAGEANRAVTEPPVGQLLDECVRYAVSPKSICSAGLCGCRSRSCIASAAC